jgi:DNA-directed RNA polymerase subunit RPC12/RpoP
MNTHLVYKCRNCNKHYLWIDIRTTADNINDAIKIMGDAPCPTCGEYDWIYDRLGNYEEGV